MAELFGLDIAQIVSDAIVSAGNVQQGTLKKVMQGDRDPDNPTAARTPATTSHSFDGFLAVREFRLPDTLVAESRLVMSIIGASVSPAAVPAVNDTVELGDFSGTLSRLISVDPAQAAYEFEVA